MMMLGSILESLLAPSLLQLPGICPGQPGAAPGNGVRDAVQGPYSRAVVKITEVKQTPSNETTEDRLPGLFSFQRLCLVYQQSSETKEQDPSKT